MEKDISVKQPKTIQSSTDVMKEEGKIEANAIFPGVFRIGNRLATKNKVPGHSTYGEELVRIDGIEYRYWNPYRSKLAAAILKGLKEFHIISNSNLLYLGAATGTTCSHVSDIACDGVIYCVEISEQSMQKLLKECEIRDNMLPYLKDARNVEAYASEIGKVDIIYQDVSARDQAEILIRNSQLLRSNGYAYVAIKSQSIDVAKPQQLVYKEFLKKTSSIFKVIETIDIMPYDKSHLFAVMRKL
ncbi:MAG: fibrillarin-like rRNA/tRNA 2'-O-methyltransferase [Candidatus Micrarchaeaceae archaeon]